MSNSGEFEPNERVCHCFSETLPDILVQAYVYNDLVCQS